MRNRIIVLGGSSGIGRAVAERFAKQGWQVLVAANDLDQCITVLSGLEGVGHIACEVDVRSEENIFKLQEIVKEKFGNFEALVNSVGISQDLSAIESDFGAWDNSIQIMLYGAVKSCRALIPLMADQGRIIHITSIHYQRVARGSSAYGMAKAAITQFARSLAIELAPRNI
ncbi:MAG TPA: SDR family oxidoreductase, partial [Puia sp.]|nr:SDR family oxidoreductase [Puia sp.]